MRPLFGVLSALVVSLLLAGGVTGQLQVEWLTQKTTVTEGRTFTQRLELRNTSFGPIEGVELLGVETEGFGHAELWSWPTKGAIDLPAGATQVIKVRMRAQLSGRIELTARLAMNGGQGPVVEASIELVVQPRKIRRTAVTDGWGAATLRLGKTKLPVRIVDEDTGHPLSGVSLSAAFVRRTPHTWLVLVADPLERVPVQTIRVVGAKLAGFVPSPPGEEPAPDASASEDLQAPLDLPVRPGDATFATGPSRTVTTVRLPPGKSATKSPADARLAMALLRAAKAAAKAAAKGQLGLPAALGSELPDVTRLPPIPGPSSAAPLREQIDALIAEGATGALLLTGAHGLPLGATSIAALDLHDPRLQSVFYYTLAGATEVVMQIVTWGEQTLLLLHPIEPKKPTGAFVPGFVWSQVSVSLVGPDLPQSPSAQLPPPTFAGTVTLESNQTLGRQLVQIVDAPGSTFLLLEPNDWTVTVRRPFHEPWQNPFTSVEGAVQLLDVVQQPSPIARGQLLVTDPLEHLPPSTGVATSTVWFDGADALVPCDATSTLHYAGDTDVASVVGSMALTGDGCGAGQLVVLCGRRQTAPLRISTDCDGKFPVGPPLEDTPGPPNEQAGTYTGVATVFAVAEAPELCTWNVAWSLVLNLVLAGSGQADDPYTGTLVVSGSYHESLVAGPVSSCSVTPAAVLVERSGPVSGSTGTVNASVTGAAIPFYSAMILSDAQFDEDGRLVGTLTVKTGSSQIEFDPTVTLTLEK